MGDPKKHRKKYRTPGHPWNKQRIEVEIVLRGEYGLTNKKEIWKADSILSNFARQAKNLIAARGDQAEKEKAQLLSRAHRLGLVSEKATLDDLLSLTIKDVLERRLQTVVFRKGIAKSMKQSRQFITHNHIRIKHDIITSPGHLVPREHEPEVMVAAKSPLADETHPERVTVQGPEQIAQEAKKRDAEKKQKKEKAKKEAKEKERPEVKKKKPKKEDKKEAPKTQAAPTPAPEVKKEEPKAQEKKEVPKEEPKPKEEAPKDVPEPKPKEEPKKEEKAPEKPEGVE